MREVGAELLCIELVEELALGWVRAFALKCAAHVWLMVVRLSNFSVLPNRGNMIA